MSLLTRLSLSDFRSYADALITPGAGFVVLTGENGAGKTNILEAVSLLAPGRGLRRAALSEIARDDGPGGFAVAAQLAESPQDDRDPVSIGTGTLAMAPERRQIRINGAQAAATALSDWISILWLTPMMDRLFVDGTGNRRRFLDRLVLALHPGHAVQTTRYEAAMRARTKLLTGETRPDAGWLSALEAQMMEHGAAVADARIETVAALGARLADAPEGPFARAGLAIEGGALGDLAAWRARDAAAGRALTGPHRQDLIVTHIGKNQPADRCSTGEQKALLLGIVLAHADLVAERAGRRPVLLLDEVAAHLDPSRRAALFERLADAGGQVWMTGTEDALFAGLPNSASAFKIADGMIISI